MKFTLNTKPLVAGLDLGIINSNITKFYQKSCIVELNIEDGNLRVNTEVSAIKSELVFKGSVSGEDEYSHTFVDSLLFKNLINSVDSDVIDIEIKEGGLTVYSGKSKFNMPQVVSESDMSLARPVEYTEASEGTIEVNKSDWKFVQDYQMYAIAMSFIHPVYTMAWMGNSGDVIVGDFNNSIFTHSNKSQMPSTCLVTDTIVNLLNNLPEGSKLVNLGRTYELAVVLDPYSYVCEFSPKYEEDEGVGTYNSDIILSLFNHTDGVEVNTSKLSKYLAQAELFTKTNDDTITLSLDNNVLSLKNDSVNCNVDVTSSLSPFTVDFKIRFLKDALSHLDSEDIHLCPLIQEDQATGVILWTENMETVLAGIE